MATLSRLCAAASLALTLGFGTAALAGSAPDGTPAPPPWNGVNIFSGPKAPATNEPVELLQTSSELVVFGRQAKDPLALIVAARIMKALGSNEANHKPQGRTAEVTQKAGQPVSPDSILGEARELAKGDKVATLLIDETAAMASATFAEQPKVHQDTARPGEKDIYGVVFTGRQLAEAGVAGDGDTDLDLLVYDGNDNLVCRSDGANDREYCRWWPLSTGMFRIEVHNLGSAANLYRLATN